MMARRRHPALALIAIVLGFGITGCSGSGGSGDTTTADRLTTETTMSRGSSPTAPDSSGGAREVTCEEAFAIEQGASNSSDGDGARVGPVRFVGIDDATRLVNMTRPSGSRDYWSYKAPFEVALQPGSSVSIAAGAGGRILIGDESTGSELPSWNGLDGRVAIVPCPSRAGGGAHVATFPGGFAVQEPGCIDVTVRRAGEPAERARFPLGVASC